MTNFPALRIDQLYCSAAKVARLGLPRALEKAGAVLETNVQKDKEGHSLMLKLSKPRKPRKAELGFDLPIALNFVRDKNGKPRPKFETEFVEFFWKNDTVLWHEDEELYERLYSYCIRDVDSEISISKDVPDLPPEELKVFRHTARINARGLYVDLALCRNAIKFASLFEKEISKQLPVLTNGQVDKPSQAQALKKYLNEELGFEIENMQALTITETLKRKDVPDRVRKILEIRQSLSKSSISKYQAMIRRANSDSRLRGLLLYHGAHTGRWAGRGVQVQNFFKPVGEFDDEKTKEKSLNELYSLILRGDYRAFKKRFPNVYEALASALRGALKAEPGKILFAADFSQIEARVVHWVAEDIEGLESFKHGDPYINLACKIFDLPIEKIRKYPERDQAKRTRLGGGFGMGAKKMKKTTWEQYGIDLPLELCERSIEVYRREYPKIPALWSAVEDAAIEAVKNPGKVITPRYVNEKKGICWEFPKVQFLKKGRFLMCRIPSGHVIHYFKPMVKKTRKTIEYKCKKTGEYKTRRITGFSLSFMTEDSQTRKWKRKTIWGGFLVENIVQSIARDIMCASLLRVERAGFPVLFSVHDEGVCEVDPSGDFDLFMKLMAQKPRWAKGLPVAVEGWKGERYRK